MGLFDFIKPNKKKDSDLIDRVYKGMHSFAEVSTGLIPQELKAKNKMKIYMYCFGALDAISQEQRFDEVKTIGILSSFLVHQFDLNFDNIGLLVREMMENTAKEEYSRYMQLGGMTFIDWSNGDTYAPMALHKALMRNN